MNLVIENVDFGLLDKQRLALLRALMGGGCPDPGDEELLDGLLNMLDDWSDSHQEEIKGMS
jgi:hypothetical protein